jgi:5-carboxymethyl-2-hydroxymuconate isomerase
MPHIHLSVSGNLRENLSLNGILRQLADRLAGFETVRSSAIKAYATQHPAYEMGKGAPSGFAHLTVSILSGRPLELRKRMGSTMLGIMHERFRSSLDAGLVAVTVEVREMDRETYLK